MKSALLLVLLLVFAMGGTAAATTWTINVPEFVGEGTGPWVTWTGYGADGNDAWSRNNPGADWAQAHYHFGFGDIPTTPTPMLVEYWCPAVPPECPANWGPITFAGGAKWWGADMGPRSGSWRAARTFVCSRWPLTPTQMRPTPLGRSTALMSFAGQTNENS